MVRISRSGLDRRNKSFKGAGGLVRAMIMISLTSFLVATTARADLLYAGIGTDILVFDTSQVTSSATTFASFADQSTKSDGLTFDSAGNLFVLLNTYSLIYKIKPNGTGSNYFGTSTGPHDIKFDSLGNLVYDCAYAGVRKISPTLVDTSFGGVFNQPRGMAFDSKGNLFVALVGNEIEKIAPDGGFAHFAGDDHTLHGNPNGVNAPEGVAIDRQDNVYVANYGSNTIERFGPDGGGSIFANFGSNIYHVYGLVFDSRGDLFVTIVKSGSNYEIDRITPNGSISVFATGLSSDGYSQSGYMAIQPSISAVPEPSSVFLIGLGAVTVMAARRRMRSPG